MEDGIERSVAQAITPQSQLYEPSDQVSVSWEKQAELTKEKVSDRLKKFDQADNRRGELTMRKLKPA